MSHTTKSVPVCVAPATSYEARRALDDARRLLDGAYGLGARDRIDDLLGMLVALLEKRIERAASRPSGRCEQCGHAPDAFDYDQEGL